MRATLVVDGAVLPTALRASDALGLARGTVRLADWTPRWAEAFAAESRRLAEALGPLARAIGSLVRVSHSLVIVVAIAPMFAPVSPPNVFAALVVVQRRICIGVSPASFMS